jgi:hypothetical protein
MSQVTAKLYHIMLHLHPILMDIQRRCTLHSRNYVLFLYAGIPLGVVLADHRYIVQWRCTQSRRPGQVTRKTTVWIEIKKTSVKHKMLIRENSRQIHA